MIKEQYKKYIIYIESYNPAEKWPDDVPRLDVNLFDYVIRDETGECVCSLGECHCFYSVYEATIAAKERIDSITQDRKLGG